MSHDSPPPSAETQKDEHPWVFLALGITIVVILVGVLAAVLLRNRGTSFAPPPSGPAPVSRWGFRSDVGVRVNNLKRVRVPREVANPGPASGSEVLLINVTVTNLSKGELVVRPEDVRFISGAEKEYAAQPLSPAAAGQDISVLGGTLRPSESATGDVVTSLEAAPISDAGYR